MNEPARIRYRLDLPDGTRRNFDFYFDPVSFAIRNSPPSKPPFWTELKFNQCANCPLNPALHPHCPVALQVANAIEELKTLVSFDAVDVTVEQAERTITVATTVQQVLASMFGLIMASSGCPWTDHLRPMARFHLPFASEEETVYRIVSMYVLAQRMVGGRQKANYEPLRSLYENLHVVNRDMARRLGAAAQSDPARNAIALLDTFTTLLPDALEQSLAALQPLFGAWKPRSKRAI
jgi:hypothetical protein